MATMLRPKLEIGLGLAKLGLDKGLKEVQRGLHGIEKAGGAATGVLGKMTGVLGRISTIAAGLGLFRLVQKIGGSFRELKNEILDFDEAMHNVFSIANDGKMSFDGLRDSVLQLAEDPRITDMPKTLAAGLYDIVSAGFDAADAMIILRAAAVAATAGLTQTNVSAGVITGILNTYSMDASEATRVSDLLFQTVLDGVVTFPQLADAIGYVLPTAKALGITLEEVDAAYVSMTRQNIDANTASANLSGILTGLLKPTEAMTELLQANGYASGDALVQALGFAGALQFLGKAIGGNATRAAELFGDVRALRGILALTNEDGKLYKEGLEGQAKAQEGVGATAKVLAEQMKSARFQLRLLRKNLVVFFTEGIGGAGVKKFAAFLAIFNRFFTRMFKLRREFNNLKGFLLSFHTLLHQLFGQRVGDAFFEAFREGIRIFRLFRDLVNGDWARAWKQFQRIGRDGERFLRTLWKTIAEIYHSIPWKNIWEFVRKAAAAIWDFIAPKIVDLGKIAIDGLPHVAGKLKVFVKDAAGWIWRRIKQNWHKVIDLKDFVVDGLPYIGGKLKELQDHASDWIKKALHWSDTTIINAGTIIIRGNVQVQGTGKGKKGFWKRLGDEIKKIPHWIYVAFVDIPRKLGEKSGKEWVDLAIRAAHWIARGIVKHWPTILLGTVAVIAVIVAALFGAPVVLAAIIAAAALWIMEFVVAFIKNTDWAAIGEFFVQSIADWTLVALLLFIKFGETAVGGFILGLYHKAREIYDAIKKIFLGIIYLIEAIFGIASPSKVMMDIGVQVMQGFFEGMVSIWRGTIRPWLHDRAQAIVNAVMSKIRLIYNLGRDIVSWLWTGIVSLLNWFEIQSHELINRPYKAIQDLLPWMYAAGRDLVSGFWNGIVSLTGWLQDQIWAWAKSVIPDRLEKFFGIGSPSKMMMEYGKNIVQGLALGMSDNKHLAKKAIDEVMQAMSGGTVTGTFSPRMSRAIAGGAAAGGGVGSTNFTGPITVIANDPQEFARKMIQAKNRRRAGRSR